jgi:hypothetical protein
MAYRYEHFRRKLLAADMAFPGGPAPGREMPDFDLPTTDGGRVRKADFVGHRPLLLAFASFTCPMTASAGPALKRLHEEFGDRVAFVSLYVREAHPGDRYPQPQTFERKLQHARAYRERDGLSWPVAVEDVDGTLYRDLNPKPSSVYLMDRDGAVAFRALWSNDEATIRDGLEVVVEGRRPARPERLNRVKPMTRGLGCQYEVLDRAGPTAKRDLLREAPPMYAMARMAAMLEPLPPLARGAIAQALGLAPMFALAAVAIKRRGGRR